MLANVVTAILARLSTYGPRTGCSLNGGWRDGGGEGRRREGRRGEERGGERYIEGRARRRLILNYKLVLIFKFWPNLTRRFPLDFGFSRSFTFSQYISM